MPSGLEALRQATQSLHAAVERTEVMARILRPPLTAAAYAAYLGALAAGVAPLALSLQHSALRPSLACTPAWDCLGDDLRSLGVERSAASPVDALPAHPDAIWGRIYVVRGAEAGLSMVARQLDRLAPDRSLPRRFLDAAAAHRGDWPRICQALACLEGEAQRAAVAVAVADFQFTLDALAAGGRPVGLRA